MMVPSDTPFTLAMSSAHSIINDLLLRSPSDEDFAKSVSTTFRQAFPDRQLRCKIPYLTVHRVDESMGKIVRWKGMVQDNSLGNEIVLKTLPGGGKRCALYGGDSIANSSNGQDVDGASSSSTTTPSYPSNSDLTERAVIYAASLPGRSRWASKLDRDLENEDGSDATAFLTSQVESLSVTSSDKRILASQRGVAEKLPVPDEQDAVGVLLKILDVPSAEALQVGDVVEVVGILDRSSLPQSDWASTGASQSEASPEVEEEVYPTLHVLFHDKVSDVWALPSLMSEGQSASQSADEGKQTRSKLLEQLSQTLAGDEAAAEWTLLSSIASIHTRKAPFALGHLSSRLHLPSATSSKPLQDLLSQLLPSTVPFHMTLSSLNSTKTHFTPRNPVGSNEPSSSTNTAVGLHASRLQLPKGTLLLIDEDLAEGSLSEHGLRNLQSLQTCLTGSTLGYEFPYNPTAFQLPVDFNTILLSQREASHDRIQGGLVQVDVEVFVKESSPSTAVAAAAAVSTSDLTSFRTHLRQARQLAQNLVVTAPVAESIQKDFVTRRKTAVEQEQNNSSTQEDLLRRMDVARLIAASHLRTELALEDYLEAVKMDEERLRGMKEAKDKGKATK